MNDWELANALRGIRKDDDTGYGLAYEAAARIETLAEHNALLVKDANRLDWMQQIKHLNFRPTNPLVHHISAIEIWTEPSQHVRGNTVREAIDNAMAKEQG